MRQLEPGLRLVRAPNPSPMTAEGTNSYIVGEGEVAVIDPGPDDPAHLAALLAALRPGERVSHILVTHAHRDHSPLARTLAEATGAPVLAHGRAEEGRSQTMAALAAAGHAGGGEGVDTGFAPDRRLSDGDVVEGAGWRLTALHTPGHMAGHLSFAWDDRLFSGDHVMGWASSLISPPDGDLAAFVASCRRLAARRWRVFHPGHGAPVSDPAARLAWLIAHRQARHAALAEALARGLETVPALTAAIYAGTPPALLPAAERNVFAHLVALVESGAATASPALGPAARYRPAEAPETTGRSRPPLL